MAIWNDNNRFDQSGYSAPTIFPQEENYSNIELYKEDLMKAKDREDSHQEFLFEMREEEKESQRIEDEAISDNEEWNRDYETQEYRAAENASYSDGL